MKRQQNFTLKQRQKYAIRKLSVGIVAVLFGTFCYLGHGVEASAAEQAHDAINNMSNKQQNASALVQNNQSGSESLTKVATVVQNEQDVNRHKVQQRTNAHVTNQPSGNTTKQTHVNKVNVEQQNQDQRDNEQQAPQIHTDQQRKDKTSQYNTDNQVETNNAHVKTQSNTQKTSRVTRSVENKLATPQVPPKTTFNETIILPQTNARSVQVKEVREQVYRKAVEVLRVGNKAQTLGANRGINQARDSLGFIIPANTNLYVRQVKGNKAGNLRVNLATYDSRLNKTATVNSNGAWTSIKTTIDSAAFIYMPKGIAKAPQIEYYVENNLGKALPTYRKGWNQKLFERRWLEEDASYAYVDGTHHALLIPKIDRHHILNMKHNTKDYQFKNLDELITYYDDIISHYNEWAGLSDDIKSVNFNNGSKCFATADKHGAGAAYYSNDHIATNSHSIANFLTKGWLALHEVGHGYDGILTNDADIHLNEVWNNIFANQYQRYVEKRSSGWLYGNDQRRYQAAIHKRMLQNNLVFDIKQTTLREKLDFMTRMVRLTGIKGLTAMLQDLRLEAASNKLSSHLPQWISEYWMAKHNANILPYFKLYNITVSKPTEDRLEALQQSYVYPLALLITNEKERQRYIKKLGLATEYELVRSSDLTDSQVKATAQINLQLNSQRLSQDAVLKLVDGKNTVAQARIQNGVVRFNNLRPGIYKIVAPYTEDKSLPNHAFIIVREGVANNITVSYPHVDAHQRFYSQYLSLKGNNNRAFLKIDYNPGNMKVKLQQYTGVPHNYFKDEYAHIKIIKQNGDVLLDESIVGNRKLAVKVQQFNLSYGDKIIVKHREANGRRTLLRGETNEVIEVPFANDETVTYTLTANGFKINNEPDYRANGRYIAAILSDIQKFIEAISKNPNGDYRVILSNILRSIYHADEQYRPMMLQRVKPYLDKFNLA
jgi:hypothetical protein